MIDTYLASTDKTELEKFCLYFTKARSVQQGRTAQKEVHDIESGVIFPAEPAAGDPLKYYTCIRAPFPLSSISTSGIEVVDKDIGKAVMGVWV